MNVQHIESERDAVARITGVRVRETVPDTFVEGADDLRLIDLPPDQLHRAAARGQGLRPGHGRPGGRTLLHAGQPDRAPPVLALRFVAGAADREMVGLMRSRAIPGPWPATADPRRGPGRAVRGPDDPGRVPDGEPPPGRVDRPLGRDGAGPRGAGSGPGAAPRGPGDGEDPRRPGRPVPGAGRGRRGRPVRTAEQCDHDPAGKAAGARDPPLTGLPGHAGDKGDRALPGRPSRSGTDPDRPAALRGPRSPRRRSPCS